MDLKKKCIENYLWISEEKFFQLSVIKEIADPQILKMD